MKSNAKNLVTCLGALLLVPITASAAPITFQTPTTFTGDNILITGTELYGTAFNDAALPFYNNGFVASITTSNGVTFTGYQTGDVTAVSPPYITGGYLQGATTGDTNFDQVLNVAGLGGQSIETLSLNNLTVGQTYQFQVLAAAKAGGPFGFTGDSAEYYNTTNTMGAGANDTIGTAFTDMGSTSKVYSFPADTMTSTTPIGLSEIGTFVADATSQNFDISYFSGVGGTSADWLVNGVVVDNITSTPEPSTYVLMSFGLFVLATVCRRKAKVE